VPEFRSGYGPATEIAAVTLRDLVLKQLIEAGNGRAVIDRCCPLEQVIDATRYVESEQQTDNVVLTVSGGRGPERGHLCRPQHHNRSRRVFACGRGRTG
jgi:hypothetical protein